MVKGLITSVSVLTLLIIPYVINYAAMDSIVTYITDDSRIDGDYSFMPRYIEGATEVIPVGRVDFEGTTPSNYWWASNNFDNVNTNAYVSFASDLYNSNSVLLEGSTPDDMGLGSVGVRYANVGTYKGDIVDMEIIIMDINGYDKWDTLSYSSTNASYSNVYYDTPIFVYSTNSIRIYISGFLIEDSAYNVLTVNHRYQFAFYKHGTDELLDIKYSMVWDDIDYNQFVGIDDAVTLNVLLVPDTNIEVLTSGNNLRFIEMANEGSGSGDIEFVVTMTNIEENPVVFELGQCYYGSNINTRRTYASYGLIGVALAPYTTPSLHKEIN